MPKTHHSKANANSGLNDKPSAKQLTAVDLFSGAGGLTQGLKDAGFEVLAGVEIEKIPANTFNLNHPDVACINKDIRRVGAVELLKIINLKRGELDLLAGCPPCQGFSTLRTRKKARAVDDDRNDLLFEFLRIVEALSPRALMMENVPALAGDRRMKAFLKRISTLGYRVSRKNIRVEDASNYGVPQRRYRMILLALKEGQVKEAEKSDPVTVRQCLEAANLAPVGSADDPLHDHIPKRSDHVKDIIRHIPKDGGSRTALPDHLVLECHKKRKGGFRDVYGRMSWDNVSPTMTGGCGNPSKGRYLHPEEDRAISLREAALFQSFPADYKFDLSKGRDKVALMIGNALPPEFIKRHAVEIMKSLSDS
ncbi:DNA cytosine methyltransferase [Parasedimentitalea psychrophila]|uniref:Cytosine-specific methyltransferase n=1 Tax=Parasedimentitalea psychrophila TaxID=2997337 RepID=A0A9Y2P139_9RHOB|nr:DNA cytosine methyltransferase [Parasedimentitalea psychrophila]WIY23762.1 DNA cytosine methyltransferase [Parasedimentitalea psychrophila]